MLGCGEHQRIEQDGTKSYDPVYSVSGTAQLETTNGAKCPTFLLLHDYERSPTKYLPNLEEGGLLKRSEEKDRMINEITDKGRHFLTEFQRMEAFVNGFGLDI
jgi:hypothetical protein